MVPPTEVEVFIKNALQEKYPSHKLVHLIQTNTLRDGNTDRSGSLAKKHMPKDSRATISSTSSQHGALIRWTVCKSNKHKIQQHGWILNDSRNRKLHPHLPHVLRLHRLYRQPSSRHRRHLRPLPRPALLLLHRPWCLAKRETPAPTHPQPVHPTDARQRAPKMHLRVRMGKGSQGPTRWEYASQDR